MTTLRSVTKHTADTDWRWTGLTQTLRNNILTLQAITVQAEQQEKSLVTRLLLLDNFMFILRQIKTDSVIMFGNVFRQSA